MLRVALVAYRDVWNDGTPRIEVGILVRRAAAAQWESYRPSIRQDIAKEAEI